MTYDQTFVMKKKKGKHSKYQKAKAFLYLDMIDGLNTNEQLWTNEKKQTWSVGGNKLSDQIYIDEANANTANITYEEGIGWYITEGTGASIEYDEGIHFILKELEIYTNEKGEPALKITQNYVYKVEDGMTVHLMGLNYGVKIQ